MVSLWKEVLARRLEPEISRSASSTDGLSLRPVSRKRTLHCVRAQEVTSLLKRIWQHFFCQRRSHSDLCEIQGQLRPVSAKRARQTLDREVLALADVKPPALRRARTQEEILAAQERVREHLRKLGLAMYAENLLDAGYDDWEQVMQMEIGDINQLTSSLGFKRGHAERLRQHVHNAHVLAKAAEASAVTCQEKADRLFARIDADGDGTISKSEFLAFLASGGIVDIPGMGSAGDEDDAPSRKRLRS